MYDVVALGELLIDFACVETGADGYPVMAAHPGGAPANFLAALSKYGAKTALLGKVGDDSFGRLLLGTLQAAGIDGKGVILSETAFTTLAFVTFDERGDREFAFARKPGADTALQFEELDLSIIDQTRVFHFGTLSLTDEPAKTATERAVAYAKERGKLVTFDPNLRKPLWKDPGDARAAMEWGLAQADVVKISDDEVAFLWGLAPDAGAEKILKEYGAQLVFVTCGAKGCRYRTRTVSGGCDALWGIDVLDTTGAGDIFGGSVIGRLLKCGKGPEELTAEDLQKMVRFATIAAGLSTTRSGGIPSIPSEEEIRAWL